MPHPLKNIFNKIFWDKRENPRDYSVTFIHRGAPGDIKRISVSSIEKVGASWFTYSSGEDESTVIPFHRIIEIKNVKSKEVLWRSRKMQTAVC